jgi:hypothetical protein
MRGRQSTRSVAAMSSIELSHPHAAARRAPVRPFLRLRVLVHRGRLDRLIAEGRDPATDPQLSIRAAQLGRPALRASLARSLLNAVRTVDNSAISRFPSPHVPVAAASVRACSTELHDLARALTDVTARVRGVAITRVLITDGAGPLYVGGPANRLRNVIVAARSAL